MAIVFLFLFKKCQTETFRIGRQYFPFFRPSLRSSQRRTERSAGVLSRLWWICRDWSSLFAQVPTLHNRRIMEEHFPHRCSLFIALRAVTLSQGKKGETGSARSTSSSQTAINPFLHPNQLFACTHSSRLADLSKWFGFKRRLGINLPISGRPLVREASQQFNTSSMAQTCTEQAQTRTASAGACCFWVAVHFQQGMFISYGSPWRQKTGWRAINS